MATLLEVSGLHAYYGKSHVLHGVSLAVGEGEIVSLLGRNGVGRSTTVKAIMGQVAASGSVRFRGEDIVGLPAYAIAQKGIGYVPENRDIFPALTTEQNLLLGEKRGSRSRWTLDDMYRLFPALGARRRVQAGFLSGGEQQMLALCRTLMGNPDLVMIDEPTEGLAPKIVAAVAEFLQRLQVCGISVLLVEQKLAIALSISQRVYVMGRGAVVYEGSPDSLRDDAALRKEWLEV